MRDERYDGAMVWSDLKVSKAILFLVRSTFSDSPMHPFEILAFVTYRTSMQMYLYLLQRSQRSNNLVLWGLIKQLDQKWKVGRGFELRAHLYYSNFLACRRQHRTIPPIDAEIEQTDSSGRGSKQQQ